MERLAPAAYWRRAFCTFLEGGLGFSLDIRRFRDLSFQASSMCEEMYMGTPFSHGTKYSSTFFISRFPSFLWVGRYCSESYPGRNVSVIVSSCQALEPG